MAKAIAVWTGTHTSGTHTEVAMRDDGVYFTRDYGFNGYGKGWSAWSVDREQEHVPAGERMPYGFATLRPADPARLRLPNLDKVPTIEVKRCLPVSLEKPEYWIMRSAKGSDFRQTVAKETSLRLANEAKNILAGIMKSHDFCIMNSVTYKMVA